MCCTVCHLGGYWIIFLSLTRSTIKFSSIKSRNSCSRNKPTSSVNLDSLQMDATSPSGAPSTCSAPDSTAVPANEMITQNYAFRPELFKVTKPYITSAVHKECLQSGQNEDLVTGAKQDVSISIGKVGSVKLFFKMTQNFSSSISNIFSFSKYKD